MQNVVRAMQISRVFARGAFARLKFLFLLKLSYYFIEKYCRFGRRRLGVRRRRVLLFSLQSSSLIVPR